MGSRKTIVALLLVCCPLVARAEVVQIEIADRRPFADGRSFGQSGPYERLSGKLWIEVDPSHPANSRIVDLKLAPTTSEGKVRYWTEFFLLKPVDVQRGNRHLLFDVNNRGNKLALAAFNEARGNDPLTVADAGNGFLMRRGYCILWCGWNGDVAPGDGRMQIELPVARNPDGPITGRIYSEICVDEKTFAQPLCPGNTRVYPAASLDNATATLSMRPTRFEAAVEIPRDQWSFARLEGDQVVPDPTSLHIRDGFRPGWLYDLVYVGKDPRVSGLGSAAVRDVVSFFRYVEKDREGLANPLAGGVDRTLVFGISQSGRFIHHFIFEDFNGDEAGRTVFDAAFSHVAGAGKAVFNARFAQITRYGSQHEENLFPSDVFPFTTVSQSDPPSRRLGNWLERSRVSRHLPRIFITQTSTEYWNRGASLLHADLHENQDIALDPSVRLYHIAGGHHLFSPLPGVAAGRYELNALDYRPVLRALLVALDEWVSSDKKPPANRYPLLANGTLVSVTDYRNRFPRIPGVDPPESAYAPLRLDPGPRWDREGIADEVPPKTGAPYRTFVPAVDEDGNEKAGIRLPDVAVPVATYAGWNLRSEAEGASGMMTRWTGSMFPFPRAAEDQARTGDPRRTILDRYPTREEYLGRVREVAAQLERDRFILAEDVSLLIETAKKRSYWP